MDGTVTITLQSVAQISATPPHYSYFNLIFDFFFSPPLTAALKLLLQSCRRNKRARLI